MNVPSVRQHISVLGLDIWEAKVLGLGLGTLLQLATSELLKLHLGSITIANIKVSRETLVLLKAKQSREMSLKTCLALVSNSVQPVNLESSLPTTIKCSERFSVTRIAVSRKERLHRSFGFDAC